MYEIRSTKAYRKAYKRASRASNFSDESLNKVVNTLARGERLATRCRDHQLTGDLKGCRECHVANDMLLVYRKYDEALILLLIDIGSHSAVF